MARGLIKSKARKSKYGEVFTPSWLVKKMLTEPSIFYVINSLDGTILEPSAGEGAFMTKIYRMRLNYVDDLYYNFGMSNWEANALQGISTIYGIELLDDNLEICQHLLMEIVQNYHKSIMQNYRKLNMIHDPNFLAKAESIIKSNIVQGNTLTHKTKNGDWITFKHWQISEDGITSTDFKYDDLFR